MTLYLIDDYSGYVWGKSSSDDPIAACQFIDWDCGYPHRTYEDIGPNGEFAGRSGYHVHSGPDIDLCDGRDTETIDRIGNWPLVTRIVTKPIGDDEDAPI